MIPAKNSSSGFTLIEILMSIFMMSVLFGIFQIAIITTRLNRTIENQELALRAAATHIEYLRSLGYASLPDSGLFANEALISLPHGQGYVTITAVNNQTKQAVATVSWKEAGKATTSTASLTTLITSGGL